MLGDAEQCERSGSLAGPSLRLPVSLRFYPVFFHLVPKDTFRGLEGHCRLSHIPAAALERANEQLPFKPFHSLIIQKDIPLSVPPRKNMI